MADDGALDWLLGRPGGVRRTLLSVVTGRFDPHEVLAKARPVSVASEDGWHDALGAAEVPEGAVVEVAVGGRPLAVGRTRGELFALDGTCPHAGGPLGEGEVSGRELACPLHGWGFDLATGVCSTDPAYAVAVHEAREQGGRVQIRLRDAARVAPAP